MKRVSSARFSSIDTLRGIAALLVIWQHSAEKFINLPDVANNGRFIADITQDLDFGRIGIVCFFLISGFVIPSSFKPSASHPIKNFIVKRFFRLFPAYWLSILLILMYFFYIKVDIQTTAILANFTMLQSFFSQPHLIGLYWTLQIELVFYLFCVVLYYFNQLNNDKLLFIIISFFFTLFMVIQLLIVLTDMPINISKEFQILPYIISIMFLGSLCRKIYDGKLNSRLYLYTKLATLMCFGLPLFLLITSLLGFELVEASFRFGAGHSLAILLFFIGIKYFNKPPKFMLWLGTISYSLYLFHPIILEWLLHFIIHSNFSNLQGLHVIIYMTIITIASIIFASVLYKYIESPSINLGRKLSKGHNNDK